MLEIVTIKEVKIKIGKWCRQKRTEYDISQENLAQALNMSRITIQQLEAGSNVTLDTLLKVANHFTALPDIYHLFENADNNNDSLY